LVDLQERHHALVLPQVLGGALAVDLAVHRLLEEDRPDDAVAVERRVGDDAGPHLVDEVEHLVLAGVLALVDAVELERLGRGSTALVEGGDEARIVGDLVELLLVHGRVLLQGSVVDTVHWSTRPQRGLPQDPTAAPGRTKPGSPRQGARLRPWACG